MVGEATTELCLYIIGYIECVSTHFWQLSQSCPKTGEVGIFSMVRGVCFGVLRSASPNQKSAIPGVRRKI